MELFLETAACGRDAFYHGQPGDKGLATTFQGLPLVTCFFQLVLTFKGTMALNTAPQVQTFKI